MEAHHRKQLNATNELFPLLISSLKYYVLLEHCDSTRTLLVERETEKEATLVTLAYIGNLNFQHVFKLFKSLGFFYALSLSPTLLSPSLSSSSS